eukprot:675838-Alexandrium_andersonii.AAC.1
MRLLALRRPWTRSWANRGRRPWTKSGANRAETSEQRPRKADRGRRYFRRASAKPETRSSRGRCRSRGGARQPRG